MAWLYCPFVQESEGSNWGSSTHSATTRSEEFELFATSSGTLSQRPASWQGWKKRPWRKRLSGTTLPPSMAERGTARWIASLPDSLARTSASQASEPGSTDREAPRGTTAFASYAKSSQSWSSSRTSRDLFAPASTLSSRDWPRAGSMRSGIAFARRPWERRTAARDVSYSRGEYPTPSAARYDTSQNEGKVPHPRPSRGTPSLDTWASRWPTPNTRDCAASGRHTTTTGIMHPGTTLTDAMRQWPTPASRDWRAPNSPSSQKRRASTRSRNYGSARGQQLPNFLAHSLPARLISLAGLDGLPEGARLRLSPLFVERLMGFPSSWTDCDV